MKMSQANPYDFKKLLDSTNKLSGFHTTERMAQAFIDIIYDQFQESLVLLRLFTSVPYSALPDQDRLLVDKKIKDSGTTPLFSDKTPVLALLGSRGQEADWNDRRTSKGFRCIPLVSSGYVESLSMLSMQFRTMRFDLKLFDNWNSTVVINGHANEYAGMLYVNHAGTDRDEQGRMIVPRQEFVAENNVKTVLGFGGGYSKHPSIVTLFAFTNELLSKEQIKPFSSILEAYLSVSEELVGNGLIFS